MRVNYVTKSRRKKKKFLVRNVVCQRAYTRIFTANTLGILDASLQANERSKKRFKKIKIKFSKDSHKFAHEHECE
jgi:hypothetical protein